MLIIQWTSIAFSTFIFNIFKKGLKSIAIYLEISTFVFNKFIKWIDMGVIFTQYEEMNNTNFVKKERIFVLYVIDLLHWISITFHYNKYKMEKSIPFYLNAVSR